MDIQNMTKDALLTLRYEITQELEKRNKQQQEKLWRAVRESITAYVELYGSIEVNNDDDMLINSEADLTEIGKIFTDD